MSTKVVILYHYTYTHRREIWKNLIFSLNANYVLQTAKISGFGGMLQNKTKKENPPTCSLKEANVKVLLIL